MCDRPTLTLVAQKCVAQGWLVRKGSEADRRSVRLRLTGTGEELLDRIESSRALLPEALGDPLDALSSEERAAFRSMLERVKVRAEELYRSKAGTP
jgi:DNA-binding MarR family transcriptional regulator